MPSPASIASPASELRTTSTPGRPNSEHIVGERRGARVEHRHGTQRPYQRALLLAARCRQYFGPEVACHLKRSQAHTTRRRMNQHALAPGQSRKVMQSIPGGEEHDRQRGRIFGRKTGGIRATRA
jgi:hypothetical protein